MPYPLRPSVLPALRRAAREFTRRLQSAAVLDATAHIEAVVHAPTAEPVFQFEAVLKAAWPAAAGHSPRREVVWAAASAPGAKLQLRAFDDDGRLLLRSCFGPEAAEPAR